MMKKLKIGVDIFSLLPLSKQKLLVKNGYNPTLWKDKPHKVSSELRGRHYFLFDMEIGESYSIVGLTGLMTLQQKCGDIKRSTGMVFHINTTAGIVIRIA